MMLALINKMNHKFNKIHQLILLVSIMIEYVYLITLSSKKEIEI
jgi:hypothetical protein